MEKEKIYYTPKELASKILVNVCTVYAWIREKELPVKRRGKNGHIRIDYHEFLEWWKV